MTAARLRVRSLPELNGAGSPLVGTLGARISVDFR